MDNRRASDEETGWNQENRDRAIADRWGVHTPYVLFSRHRFLDGMPIAPEERSNEMLLPTQIQRSLFYLEEISDAEAEQTPIPFHYHLQTQAWNIVECIFGIYKHHFGVVEAAPEYSPKIQAIFIAVFRGVAIESWINNAGTWGATSSASSSRTPQDRKSVV